MNHLRGRVAFFDSKDGLRNVQSYSTLEEETYRGLVWTLGPPREETLEEEKENRPIYSIDYYVSTCVLYYMSIVH